MSATPQVSIIFPVKNEGANVKSTLDSLFSVKTPIPFEAIVVDDASTDGCCKFIDTYKHKVKLIHTKGIGAARARNLGAEHAKGKYLAFCDAHLEFEHYWLDGLILPLEKGRTDAVAPAIAAIGDSNFIGYGMSLSRNLRIKWNKKKRGLFDTAIIPGGCFIITKKVFNEIGGFEKGFKTWGHEDVELSIRLWLFGYRCSVLPEVRILHLFRKSHPYKVSNEEVSYNLLRMAYSHFNYERIEKCRKLITGVRPSLIEQQVKQDGVLRQRHKFIKIRKYDDDWYFSKFRIQF
ncbi:glycosyltransferase [Cytobacillus sp. SAFR-174]|uniref:glycosyltransferase n=1 Tax=Cytobacillus sp. SAFR-174 TaxID=3436868 RepID=UPI0026BEC77E